MENLCQAKGKGKRSEIRSACAAARFSLAGDAGGFTLSSQLTWQVTALFGFDFRCFEHPCTLSIGMRAIADDYAPDSTNKITTDLILWGPILAWDIRF